MSVKLPHIFKCLSVNASMAVNANFVTSLIFFLFGSSEIFLEQKDNELINDSNIYNAGLFFCYNPDRSCDRYMRYRR